MEGTKHYYVKNTALVIKEISLTEKEDINEELFLNDKRIAIRTGKVYGDVSLQLL